MTNILTSIRSNLVSSKYFRNNLDQIISIAGIILGFAISGMNLIYSNAYLLTIGPMLIIACTGYLLFRHKLSIKSAELEAKRRFVKIVQIIFWISFAISIFSFSTEILHRPLIYFILTSFSASMIALQILYSQSKWTERYILIEIFLITLSVAASAYWVFPSLPGSDPWEHLIYIQDFVNSGHIESSRGLIYYLSYPITHLSAVNMKLITLLDYKTVMFLGIGLPLILSTLFVFLIGRSLINAKVGLMATLLVNLSDIHLQFNIQLMPTSLGIALFTIIFYLLIRNKSRLDIKNAIITILFALLMIITHNMSSFVLFICLVCLLIGDFTYNSLHKNQSFEKNSIVTPALLMLFIIAVIAYWTYAGYIEGKGFLEAIVQGLNNSLTDSGFLNRAESSVSEYGSMGPILHIMGFIILYLFGTIGVLLWSSRRYLNKSRFTMMIAVIFMTAVALAFPVFGMRNIMPYRWYAYIYVPLGIIASFSILTIIEHLNSVIVKTSVLITVVAVLIFFMISNSFSNVDSPVYAPALTERLVYTTSEIAAGKEVIDIYDGLIVSDLQYSLRVLGTYLGREKLTSHDMLNDATVNQGLVIWRDIMAEREVQVSEGMVVLQKSYEQKLEISDNLIYSNNTSKAFFPRDK